MAERRNIVYSTLVHCVTALLSGLGLDVDCLDKVGFAGLAMLAFSGKPNPTLLNQSSPWPRSNHLSGPDSPPQA